MPRFWFFIGVFVVVVVVLLVCLFFTAESILTKWSLTSNCHLSQNTFIQHSWRNKMYFYSVAMHASFSSSSSFLFSSALASKINNFFPPFAWTLLSDYLCWLRIILGGMEVGKMLSVLSVREGKYNTNIWQCADMDPRSRLVKLNLLFFLAGDGLTQLELLMEEPEELLLCCTRM